MTGEVPRVTGADDPTSEDRTLLARLRAGEDAAFGQLFSRHSTAVYRLAIGLVNDRAEAEDLTAEAFFRVLQAIRRGSGPVDNVRAYLLIVVRRVALEWSLRRRDVPVSDEELTNRAPSNPDTSGAFTERNLIRRAFTSLPERWRRVLWKMEVEGERPAVVATNFGLSPNATAALARRARQGLRAAYLQAHLAADRHATGCRSVLEKLGAYTAGSTRGIEHRRIRAHLAGCPSCTAMHAELRDVCSGLRAHAAYLALPAAFAAGATAAHLAAEAGAATAGTAGTAATAGAATAGTAVGGGTATAAGVGVATGTTASVVKVGGLTALKGVLATTKAQVVLALGSAAAIGVLGFVSVTSTGDGPHAPVDLAGKRGVELNISDPPSSTSSTLRAAEGELTTHAEAPRHTRQTRDEQPADDPVRPTSDQPPAPASGTTDDTGARIDTPLVSTGTFDETSPIRYREETVERRTETTNGATVVYETTTVTEVNAADQTRVTTETTTYTQPTSTPSGGQPTPRTVESTPLASTPDGP
ncbi:sigma-70 family RNA polymerase sigma factor [Actinophytocola gossypii]|uniref:Sigma-70 family RNA polymerase sigma factor n=1 Tax=Actinophytocola gossypii TaxID=2812003 RepID=A0ABT2JFR6_9PSEU|nr:sigma-70 family RNA polymerase sigma factor [Actinophytocola gossypii]MCT2586593.1 sigma-70 family RNA polymerase sigma factor [Actinophytocola gossypii]